MGFETGLPAAVVGVPLALARVAVLLRLEAAGEIAQRLSDDRRTPVALAAAFAAGVALLAASVVADLPAVAGVDARTAGGVLPVAALAGYAHVELFAAAPTYRRRSRFVADRTVTGDLAAFALGTAVAAAGLAPDVAGTFASYALVLAGLVGPARRFRASSSPGASPHRAD